MVGGLGFMELLIILFILFILAVPAVVVIIIVVLARRNKGPRELPGPGVRSTPDPPPLPPDAPGPEDD